MLMAAVLLMLTQPAPGLDEEYSDSPEAGPCDEARNQNEINACAAGELEAADAALNEQWRENLAQMRRLDGDGQWPDGQPGFADTLRSAQRAWLTYRDEHCRAASYVARGGSMQTSAEHLCKARVTQQRTFELYQLSLDLSN
jgi:uncharacterized protein YecT (DUF1311 family)